MATSDYTTLINVLIEQHREERMFALTSKDVPGLFLAGRDLPQLLADVPAAIKLLFKANYGMDVDVSPAVTHGVTEPIDDWMPVASQFVASPVPALS